MDHRWSPASWWSPWSPTPVLGGSQIGAVIESLITMESGSLVTLIGAITAPRRREQLECQAPRISSTLAKDDRAVGHDAVDAEIEQSLHLRSIVDRPHVHVQSQPMGSLDETTIDHGQRTLFHRHLRSQAPQTANKAVSKQRHLDRAERGAQLGAQLLAQAAQPRVAERADTHPRQRVGAAQGGDERVDSSIGLCSRC